MSRRLAIAAVLTAFALTILPIAAGAADKLVLQLHREPQFEFAGYYAALWQGLYQEAGLDVEITPGTPPGAIPIDPVREITEGRAQFGTGTVQLLIRAAQGQSLLLLAPVFQQSGAAVYYRADSDFSSPGALLAGRVGRLPASNILDLELRTALHSEAIDPDKLRFVPIEPGQTIADLDSRRIDAAVGSAWELPWQAHERGVALRSFNLAGYRTEFYGDSLFTLQRLARVDPAMVQRFREASIKGWDYALQHPDEIAARILAKLPVQVPVSDPIGFVRYQTEVARRLARYPDVPLGHSNPERWSRIQQSLIDIGVISRPVDLDAFLFEPAAAVRHRSNWQASPLLVAAGAIVLLVATGLLWRRRSWWSAARSSMTEAPNRLRTALHRLVASPGGGAIERCPTDLNATLRALERSLRRRLPGSVDCRLSLLPELWLCHADPDAVAATVRDLVAAAVADMPAGGDLVVGTRQYSIDDAAAAEFAAGAVGDYVRLTVKDNGSGLSGENLDGIFARETTVKPAVAAARELTHRLGGFARIESVEGIGTAVHLYFRRTEPSAESVPQRSPEEVAPTRAAAA
jgi:ABC-type nitrate/sulfonate/bicarbonate transport system substrate-binding protein